MKRSQPETHPEPASPSELTTATRAIGAVLTVIGLILPACTCYGQRSQKRNAAHSVASARSPLSPGPQNAHQTASPPRVPTAKVASAAPVVALPATALRQTPLADRLGDVTLGTPERHGALTLVPVMARPNGGSAFGKEVLTLDVAFAARSITVTEEGSATVPFVSVTKPQSREIFIMTGELFVGAQQDRISRHDLLLPVRPGRFRLPVYCVEQGRWGGGTTFHTGNALSTQSLRQSAAAKGSQVEVWGKVAAKTGNVGARTDTNTMAASYRSKLFLRHSGPYLKAFMGFPSRYPQAIGVLALLGDRVFSLDLFETNDLLVALWEKLLKAFVLDALDPQRQPSGFDGARPEVFLAALGRATFRPTATPGLGREYLISSKEVSGSALLVESRVLHLALFPEQAAEKTRLLDSNRSMGSPPAARGVEDAPHTQGKRAKSSRIRSLREGARPGAPKVPRQKWDPQLSPRAGLRKGSTANRKDGKPVSRPANSKP